jgi:hypothetical protein
VTSRTIVQVRCSPSGLRKIRALSSTSISDPSPRIIRATPRTDPVRPRSATIAPQRSSV